MKRTETASHRKSAGSRGFIYRVASDAVESGASIGFLPPLSAEEARHWRSGFDAMQCGARVLIVAELGGRVTGSVQFAL
jgi:acetyltransferase